MRKLALAGLAIIGLLLVGCGTQTDTFAVGCEDRGGEVMSDSTSSTVTSVNTSGGGVGVGTVTTTVRLCIVDGDIVDMEVQ